LQSAQKLIFANCQYFAQFARVQKSLEGAIRKQNLYWTKRNVAQAVLDDLKKQTESAEYQNTEAVEKFNKALAANNTASQKNVSLETSVSLKSTEFDLSDESLSTTNSTITALGELRAKLELLADSTLTAAMDKLEVDISRKEAEW
jgi:dipeptidase